MKFDFKRLAPNRKRPLSFVGLALIGIGINYPGSSNSVVNFGNLLFILGLLVLVLSALFEKESVTPSSENAAPAVKPKSLLHLWLALAITIIVPVIYVIDRRVPARIAIPYLATDAVICIVLALYFRRLQKPKPD